MFLKHKRQQQQQQGEGGMKEEGRVFQQGRASRVSSAPLTLPSQWLQDEGMKWTLEEEVEDQGKGKEGVWTMG